LFDAQNGVVINRSLWFGPQPSDVSTTITNSIFTTASTSNPAIINGDAPVTSALWVDDAAKHTAAIAASDLQVDGYRFSWKTNNEKRVPKNKW